MGNFGINKQQKVQYSKSKKIVPLPSNLGYEPLAFSSSMSLDIPSYPLSCIGILSGKIRYQQNTGFAFIIHRNYIMTCASNCYSHELNQDFSDLIFTIRSRKTGKDKIFKISSVFMPQQYRFLPRKQREPFNYAVLKIEGQTNFQDQFGVLGFVAAKNSDQKCLYIKHQLLSLNRLRIISAQPVYSNHKKCLSTTEKNIYLNGGPLLQQNNGKFIVVGISFRAMPIQTKFMNILRFTTNNCLQISSWATAPSGQLFLQKYDQKIEDVIEWLKEQQVDHVNQLTIQKLSIEESLAILESIPFNATTNINLYLFLQDEDKNYQMLKSAKCKNLRTLSLISGINTLINPANCESIISAGLQNLRQLLLFNFQVGEKGCQILRQGKWPELNFLYLSSSSITFKGFCALCEGNWPNLRAIQLAKNDLSIAKIMGLVLNNKMWASLKYLSLTSSMIGSNFCKMIKQADFTLRRINLEDNQITDIGLKWLCKSKNEKLVELNLNNNPIQRQFLSLICMANMPLIKEIVIYNRFYTISYLKLKVLMKAEWEDIQKIIVHSHYLNSWHSYYQNRNPNPRNRLRHLFS